MKKKLTIPSDWKSDFLGNLASISTGSKNTQDKVDDGDYPFFVRSQTIERINSYSYDGEAVLTAGDGVGTGKVFHHVNGKFDFHQRVYKISDFKNSLLPSYFFEYFRKNFIRQVVKYTAKTSVDSVRMEMLTQMEIPLPPLEEQKKIAQILSTWDEAIEAVEKLITTKKQLKKSILQKAFSNNLPQKKLSELSIGIYDGTHTTPKYTNEGIPFLSVENITARNFSNTKFISLKEHEQLVKRCSPKQGDILMTRIGSIGDTAYVDWDFEFSIYVSLALIKPDESKINSKYLYQYTKTSIFKKEILKRSLLSAIPQKINLGDISSILVPIMPDEKQVFLAEQLDTLDEEIDLLSQKQVLLQKQKKGLMQQLLTGKTRVS